jgi:hypothetical protein
MFREHKREVSEGCAKCLGLQKHRCKCADEVLWLTRAASWLPREGFMEDSKDMWVNFEVP